jgi:hypothetical protein
MYDLDMDADNRYPTEGAKLLHLAAPAGLARLARRVELSRQTLSKLRRGGVPSLPVAMKLETELGIPMQSWTAPTEAAA